MEILRDVPPAGPPYRPPIPSEAPDNAVHAAWPEMEGGTASSGRPTERVTEGERRTIKGRAGRTRTPVAIVHLEDLLQ